MVNPSPCVKPVGGKSDMMSDFGVAFPLPAVSLTVAARDAVVAGLPARTPRLPLPVKTFRFMTHPVCGRRTRQYSISPKSSGHKIVPQRLTSALCNKFSIDPLVQHDSASPTPSRSVRQSHQDGC